MKFKNDTNRQGAEKKERIQMRIETRGAVFVRSDVNDVSPRFSVPLRFNLISGLLGDLGVLAVRFLGD